MNATDNSAVSPCWNTTRTTLSYAVVVWLAVLACGGMPALHGLAAGADEESGTPSQQQPTATEKAREVATLWAQAQKLVMNRDYENLAATLEKLLKLDPKHVEARRHAAWNLTYNLSIEPREVGGRYEWVRRGILVLIDGLDLDEKNTVLYRDTGWFIAQKIGFSDEHLQYRRLFAADQPLHKRLGKYIQVVEALGPDGKPDNWLVARLLTLRAIELVDRKETSMESMNPLIVFSQAGMCRINFARALNEEGYFGEKAVQAWREAEKEWRQFGDREIPTTKGGSVRLSEREKFVAKASRLWKQFDRLQPTLRDRLRAVAMEELPEPLHKALKTPVEQRTAEQAALARSAARLLIPSVEELSRYAKDSNREEALKLARQAVAAERQADRIGRYAGIVRFDSWLVRCRAEQSNVMRQARRLIFEAQQQVAKGRVDSDDPTHPGARRLYKQAFAKWAEAFARFPKLLSDERFCEVMMDMVDRYRQIVLDGGPLPDNFPLRAFTKYWETFQKDKKGPRMHRRSP